MREATGPEDLTPLLVAALRLADTGVGAARGTTPNLSTRWAAGAGGLHRHGPVRSGLGAPRGAALLKPLQCRGTLGGGMRGRAALAANSATRLNTPGLPPTGGGRGYWPGSEV